MSLQGVCGAVFMETSVQNFPRAHSPRDRLLELYRKIKGLDRTFIIYVATFTFGAFCYHIAQPPLSARGI